jgi:hypothetical protein
LERVRVREREREREREVDREKRNLKVVSWVRWCLFFSCSECCCVVLSCFGHYFGKEWLNTAGR